MLAQHEFQSTPPRGGRRHYGQPLRQHPGISIHAPARGATHLCDNSRPHNRDFNSHPRAGGDTKKRRSDIYIRISIHAPARGATAGLSLYDKRG